MVKSMTGYGRGEASTAEHRILVEMKSVNHRYLDLGIKLPRKLNPLEAKLRALIKTYAARGKLDIFISCEDYADFSAKIRCNEAMAAEYVAHCRQLAESLQLDFDLTVSRLARFPEVFSMEQVSEDEESLWELLEQAATAAAAAFNEQREREGLRLRDDILLKLDNMSRDVAMVEVLSPQIMAEYRGRLEAKLREVLENVSVEESRLLTEAAIYADKVCVDEETVRLRSHIEGMRAALRTGDGESVGRRLDFLAQEMNREANTILSKCNHSDIAQVAIRLKTEIEKIREQVQNIE